MRKVRKTLALALALLMALTLFTPLAMARQHSFNDVRSDRWYSEAIQFVYANGIMGGVGNNRFNVQGNLTRAEITALIFRLHHGRYANASDNRQNEFQDVGGAWYAPYVTWANSNDIDNGIGQNQFAPNRHATRQEFAAMMFRYAQFAGRDTRVPSEFNLNQFTDRDQIASGSLAAMQWANYRGIITGRTTTTLAPTGTLTRAEAATIFMRFMNLESQQRIDLRDLTGMGDQAFLDQYGHLLGTFRRADYGWQVLFHFIDIGFRVTVRNSVIVGVDAGVPYGGGDSDLFHIGGIGIGSTRSDVLAAFGQPDERDYPLPANPDEPPVVYVYILGEYMLGLRSMLFWINTNTNRVVHMSVVDGSLWDSP